jgi:hypothetical protein
MAQFLFTNNATSTLAAPITAVATTASLAPGTGVLFPAPGANQQFALTLFNSATPTLSEIVYVTEMEGDTIVVMLRGQEGTTPQSWLTGASAQLLLTAGALSALGLVATQPLPLASFAFLNLPVAASFAPGTQAFCANGRNPGEGAGLGTGTPVFVKLISNVATWCAIWSGQAVAI